MHVTLFVNTGCERSLSASFSRESTKKRSVLLSSPHSSFSTLPGGSVKRRDQASSKRGTAVFQP